LSFAQIAKLVLHGVFRTLIHRVQQWYHPKKGSWFPIGSPLFPLRYILTVQPQFAIECLRCSSNQQGVGQFGAKCGEERADMGLSYAKEIVSISSAVWAQCTNVTDRQTMELQ